MIHSPVPTSNFRTMNTMDSLTCYVSALKYIGANEFSSLQIKDTSKYGGVMWLKTSNGLVQLSKKKVSWRDITFYVHGNSHPDTELLQKKEIQKHGLILRSKEL